MYSTMHNQVHLPFEAIDTGADPLEANETSERQPQYEHTGALDSPPEECASPAACAGGNGPAPPHGEDGDPEGVIAELGRLPAGTIVYEEALARLFGRHPTSIGRAVRRGELPEPFKLFGRKAWLAGDILAHLGRRAESAAHERSAIDQKIARLRP